MNDEILGRIAAQSLAIQRLIFRLRKVDGFQMAALVTDLSKLEAEADLLDLPEEAADAPSDELSDLIEAVQRARGIEE